LVFGLEGAVLEFLLEIKREGDLGLEKEINEFFEGGIFKESLNYILKLKIIQDFSFISIYSQKLSFYISS
jgi:hypothetical protein